MSELDKYRDGIDRVDKEILKLLNERAGYAMKIGEIKKAQGKPLYVPSREMKIYQRLTEMNTGPFPSDALKSVYREIISASLALEEEQKIAFLGPEGTFTNLAAIKHFGLSAKMVPIRNIPDVFEEVTKDRADYGVIPIENSLEGVVNHTLDMFTSSDLRIVGEIFIGVSHHIMNRTGNISDIRTIYSHPHAFPQCRKWLAANMPDVALQEVESTARAALIAKEDETAAAIASEMAELVYGLRTVEGNIQDMANNYTRFLIVGSFDPQPTGNDKTSIVFTCDNESGSLYSVLESFAQDGINMTKIESRPSKTKAWEYFFYVDIDGHKDIDPVKSALENFRSKAAFLKVLGSYPKGEK